MVSGLVPDTGHQLVTEPCWATLKSPFPRRLLTGLGWKEPGAAERAAPGGAEMCASVTGVAVRRWGPGVTFAERSRALTVPVVCCLGPSLTAALEQCGISGLTPQPVVGESCLLLSLPPHFPSLTEPPPITRHCSIAYELPF